MRKSLRKAKKTFVMPKEIKFNSEYFHCPKCNYSEPRLIKGDISYTPCTNCGSTPLYRIK